MRSRMRRSGTLFDSTCCRVDLLLPPQDQCGLKDKELSSILAMLHLKRESVARGMPDYWRQREEIVSTAEETLARQRRGRDPSAESQTRPRTVQGESSKNCEPAGFLIPE